MRSLSEFKGEVQRWRDLEARVAEVLALAEMAIDEKDASLADEIGAELEGISSQVERIYPYVIGLGLIGQAGIILVLVLFPVRRLGFAVQGWKLPPFSRWRLPFYLVWLLVLRLRFCLLLSLWRQWQVQLQLQKLQVLSF